MKKFLLTTLLVLVTVVAAFAQNELTATLTCSGVVTGNNKQELSGTPVDINNNDNVKIATLSSVTESSNKTAFCSESIRIYGSNKIKIAAENGYF